MKDNEIISDTDLQEPYSNNEIALVNLATGETFDTKIKQQDNKFRQRGYTMYNTGIVGLLQKLTNSESIILIQSFNATFIDYNNIYTKTFSKVFSTLDKSTRSRLKKKLLENEIIFEHNGKYMLNPYMFIPRGDKNVHNSIYLTQQVWKYLVGESNSRADDVLKHFRNMFGVDDKNQRMITTVGKDEIFVSKDGRL